MCRTKAKLDQAEALKKAAAEHARKKLNGKKKNGKKENAKKVVEELIESLIMNSPVKMNHHQNHQGIKDLQVHQ